MRLTKLADLQLDSVWQMPCHTDDIPTWMKFDENR
jgi:hypothetical protein